MVVRTIKTASGATVRIHDDYIAPMGSEEERRAIVRQNAAARAILENLNTRATTCGNKCK